VEILNVKLESNDFFQRQALNATMSYAHDMLVYILRRPEVSFKADDAEEVLRRFRTLKPEYERQFLDLVRPLYKNIQRYMALEESCLYSGSYNAERLKALNTLEKTINDMREDSVFKYARSML
jgi:hypothetical protein